MTRSCCKRRGFTIVELLVVVAIIGLLIGLLIPAVQAARAAARRIQCQNNLKQIAIGMHGYEGVYGQVPASRLAVPYTSDIGWLTTILPFIEQGALYDQYDRGTYSFDRPNQDVVKSEFELLHCPSSPGLAKFGDINLYFGHR